MELICGLCGSPIDRDKNGRRRAKVESICRPCNVKLSEELAPKGFPARRSAFPRALLLRYQGFDAFRGERTNGQANRAS